MSLVSVPSFTYPEASRSCAWFKGTPFSTSTSVELASTNTKIGCLVQVPKAGNISAIGVQLAAVASAQGISAGLYALNTAGDPDTATPTNYKGSVDGTLASGSATAGTYQEIALGTKATSVVAGDVIAAVFYWTGTAGDVTFGAGNANYLFGIANSSGTWCKYTSGAWSATLFPNASSIALAYDDGTYADASTLPVNTVTTTAGFASPNEYGTILPGIDGRAIGAWFASGATPTAGTSCAFTLYEGTSAATATTSKASGSASPSVFAFNVNGLYVCRFSTPYAMSSSKTYCVAITPASTNVKVTYADTGSNARLGSWPGGTGTYMANRTSGGATNWTLTNTARVGLGLMIDQIDNGTGSGGGRSPRLTKMGG